MSKSLIKYKHIEDFSEYGYIDAVWTNQPFEVLRMAKQADYIQIKQDFYRYESSTYLVPKTEDNVDVIMIYVDPMDETM